MNIEQQRAAFEAWHCKKFATRHSTGQPTRDMHNGVYDEDYSPIHQQYMWEAFQAAIEQDRQSRGEPVAWGIFYLDVMQQGWGYNEEAAKAIAKEDYPELKVEVKPLYIAPQPAEPTVKESLTTAEPVKEPSDTDFTQDLAMMAHRLILDVRALADDEGPEAARLTRANQALEWLRSRGLSGSPLRAAPTPPADGQAQQEAIPEGFDVASPWTKEHCKKYPTVAATLINRFLQSRRDADKVKPVAYLDLGVGGYMDVGTDLTDDQLSKLPKGRHALGIIGTYGVDGYEPAIVVAQPDPAMAGDEWLEELNRLADYYAEKNAEAEFLLDQGTASDDIKGAEEERDSARYAFRAYASKRVQPAPAMAGDEWLNKLRELVLSYKDSIFIETDDFLFTRRAAYEAVIEHAAKRVQPAPAMAGDTISDDDIESVVRRVTGDHLGEYTKNDRDFYGELTRELFKLKRVQPASGEGAK